jgi:hypothetical protein
MRLLPVVLTFVLLFTGMLAGMTGCPVCGYRINVDTAECPNCLKLLKWPHSPERSRRGKVVVRTGTDAFIRDQHSQNRAFRFDRNAGGDLQGQIGSWGNPTALRYLIRFDVAEAFSAAGVDMKSFKLRRAFLRINVATSWNVTDRLPVAVYPLTRHFQEGSGQTGQRQQKIDGCSWIYAAPLMYWHQEGGDYDMKTACPGHLPTSGSALIDVSDILMKRFAGFAETGIWNDPGMIIMRNPEVFGSYGHVDIYSFESRSARNGLRSPELFIE